MIIEGPKSNRPNESIPLLGNVDISLPDIATPLKRETHNPQRLKVSFNGQTFLLSIDSESAFVGDAGVESVFHISVVLDTEGNIDDKNNPVATASISKFQDGTAKAITTVENHKRNLPGLGRELWKLVLSAVQKSADKWHIPVVHRVIRMPKDGLSGAQWNKLFFPLLNEYGYKQAHENDWEKIYEPKK